MGNQRIEITSSEAISVRVIYVSSTKDSQTQTSQTYTSNYDGKEYRPPVEYQGPTKDDPIYKGR